jgi:peptide-methionine (S)-S-oxide reductase
MRPFAWIAALAALPVAAALLLTSPARSIAKALPPPADAAAASEGPQTIVLAGGCFWGVQGVFQHVKGVSSAVSGYAGGPASAANYETVSTGRTGHAESVKVTFDPKVVSLGEILRIYFSVAHDPTELNRQGPDTGTQYRSEIFTTSDAQADLARRYIAQLDAAHVFNSKIVTKIDGLKGFYPAEGYHQDYLTRHPDSMYIRINDLPKVEALKQLFPNAYRTDPVLVAQAG